MTLSAETAMGLEAFGLRSWWLAGANLHRVESTMDMLKSIVQQLNSQAKASGSVERDNLVDDSVDFLASVTLVLVRE